MKVAFAMLFRNDEDSLRKILGKVPKMFDSYVFLNTGSTDSSESLILERFPNASIINDRIDHLDFGRWRTMMMDESRRLGNDWIVMVDTDEAIFKKDYQLLISYMMKGEHNVYRLARINMTADDFHYAPEFFPDFQARVINLNAGVYYEEKLHAQPKLNGELVVGQLLPHIVIYHYGWTKNGARHWIKKENYRRTQEGLPILTELPEGMVIPEQDWSNRQELFIGEQP